MHRRHQVPPPPPPHQKMTSSLSPKLIHILQHSLGVDKYGEGQQYRNHFVTSPDCEDGQLCLELVGLGYMLDHGPQKLADGMHCFTVTPEGIDAVALQSPPRPKISRSKRRYQEWLRADTGHSFADWIGASKKRAKPEANRCSEAWDIPWPGHGNAVLRRHHCRNKTTHPSGKCHLHR